MTTEHELPTAPPDPHTQVALTTTQFQPYSFYPQLPLAEYAPSQYQIPLVGATKEETMMNAKLNTILNYKRSLEQEQSEREKLKKRYTKIDKALFGIECSCMFTELGLTGTSFAVPVVIPIAAPVCLGLTIFSALLRNTSKFINRKSEKHAAIELLAKSKINSILEKYTKAMEDGEISLEEFKDINKEISNFSDMKKEILASYKRDQKEMKEMTKQVQQSFIDQGKEQVKKDLENKLKHI